MHGPVADALAPVVGAVVTLMRSASEPDPAPLDSRAVRAAMDRAVGAVGECVALEFYYARADDEGVVRGGAAMVAEATYDAVPTHGSNQPSHSHHHCQ